MKDEIFNELESAADSRYKRDDMLVAVLGIKSNPWINKVIKYDQMEAFIEEVMDHVNQYNVEKTSAYAIRLSLNETLANAHKHGNRGDESSKIFVHYLITGEFFRLTVKDEGQGFDHEALPDPTVEENLLLPHGRGIFLMRSMMDEVEFNDTGNAIKVMKYLSLPEDEEEEVEYSETVLV